MKEFGAAAVAPGVVGLAIGRMTGGRGHPRPLVTRSPAGPSGLMVQKPPAQMAIPLQKESVPKQLVAAMKRAGSRKAEGTLKE